MNTFLDDNFLLTTKTAQRLYHEVAADLPIIDYHCHLPPHQIRENASFDNLADLWLGGDHYKWRGMRAAGVPEGLITGKDVDPKERFMAWAKIVPMLVRNPLYHWTHLELKRCFDCDLILSEKTGEAVWDAVNAQLGPNGVRVGDLLSRFKVQVVGTTDDPVDDLADHLAHEKGSGSPKMVPTFRPDKAMTIASLTDWNGWVDRLEKVSGLSIKDLGAFMEALEQRHTFFFEHGCRLSDHGIGDVFFEACTEAEAARIFTQLRTDETGISKEDAAKWQTWVLLAVARWNTQRDMVMQWHIGATRNVNKALFDRMGPDVGGDGISDASLIQQLGLYLRQLESENALPRCIFYHVNPAMMYPLAALMGSFQGTPQGIVGRHQLGSGWWHLDTIDGMRIQMEALSSVGLISTFVGMLTDSRSFLSFPRHEYFRRLVCQIVGTDVEGGLIPNDPELLDSLIAGICFNNAQRYFGF